MLFRSYFIRNPRYSFEWRGYRGDIYLKSEFYKESDSSIYLRDVSLGYNLSSRKPVVAILLKDVLNTSDESFIKFIERFRFKDVECFEMNVYNRKNMFGGNWLENKELDVYTLILKGLEILNDIFKNKYSKDFLLNNVNVEDLYYFRPIYNPTSENYYLFVSEIYKFINDNISKKTLKYLILKITNKKGFDTSILIEKYQSIDFGENKALNNHGAPDLIDILYQVRGVSDFELKKFLQKVNVIRNEFSHELFINKFDENYWDLQDEILRNLYIFINVLIVNEIEEVLPINHSSYSSVFGKEGAISAWSGFNKPAYKFYDGNICLICEIFDSKDSEFLIAFKDGVNKKDVLLQHLLNKRPDLDRKIIQKFVERVLTNIRFKSNKSQMLSFFKGQASISRFHGEKIDNIATKGKIEMDDFTEKYLVDNTYCFADSTVPYYGLLSGFLLDEQYIGKGYMCDIIRDFHTGNYENDNVITDKSLDMDIQILCNIWD